MTHDEVPAYGLWCLSTRRFFIFFAFSFFKPQTKRDWRSFSAFSAFLVALFSEMYGFPLTIYLLSGWLQSKYPDVNCFSHDAGHLLEMMCGWKMLYEAQRKHTLATTGICFILVMFGFLLQWPTLLTLAMFPVLVFMYVRLARIEERESLRQFGDAYRIYMARVLGFIPRFGSRGDRARA